MGSLRKSKDHKRGDLVVQQWVSNFDPKSPKIDAKYIGYADVIVPSENIAKHNDTLCFNYYEVSINGEIRYLNVKVRSDLENREELYTIEKRLNSHVQKEKIHPALKKEAPQVP